LIFNCQEVAKECTKLGYPGKLHSYKCDLTKEGEIEEMFKWIEANHGGLDVCINNAGFSSGEAIIGKCVLLNLVLDLGKLSI
jgi:NAD(P)-dependent dehydrogenase (short-subunit alcohol dehydrogenase family)